MSSGKTDIWVYAHWKGMKEPKTIGILTAQQGKGRKTFSFEYDKHWINSQEQLILDPDIAWYTGLQYPGNKDNFGVFMDSMPDTWGRKLMHRRAGQRAEADNKTVPNLYELDFLLGVHDQTRMGALRFKTHPDGPFLDNDQENPTPPWAHIGELQQSADAFESDENSEQAKKWLNMLIAPGSSLGGARPKANIIDNEDAIWIAKFPSKSDTVDKAAWEYLVYVLAEEAGVNMAKCKIQKVYGQYRTFYTKRFDRLNGERIHFSSAMTMIGKNEESIKDDIPSYLDIAEFLQYNTANPDADLQQLWRRIVFNMSISNTDDHLRNHGFLLSKKGWRLSPAFDLNPSIDKAGLALNVDYNNNALDYELAKSVGEFFQLNTYKMDKIIAEVTTAVSKWRAVAVDIKISRSEQVMMAAAFQLTK